MLLIRKNKHFFRFPFFFLFCYYNQHIYTSFRITYRRNYVHSAQESTAARRRKPGDYLFTSRRVGSGAAVRAVLRGLCISKSQPAPRRRPLTCGGAGAVMGWGRRAAGCRRSPGTSRTSPSSRGAPCHPGAAPARAAAAGAARRARRTRASVTHRQSA